MTLLLLISEVHICKKGDDAFFMVRIHSFCLFLKRKTKKNRGSAEFHVFSFHHEDKKTDLTFGSAKKGLRYL